ncbi:MAG: pyridoxal phosphate-dependent aminotransferase [Candidatus Muiribacteriaceae bacterium]
MKASERVSVMQESPIRKLVPFADRAKQAGKTVYHLNIGQPDIETPQCFWDTIHDFEERVLSYSHSQGYPEYHSSTLDYYRRHAIDLSEDELIITTGGSEAILFAFITCLQPGDEVLVFEPFYTNYNGFAAMADIVPVPVTTYAEDGFDLPGRDILERHITDKTRGIMICNPNNPTGSVYSRKRLRELADLVKKHDLFLFSDEVYREFIYDGKNHTSVMEFKDIDQHTILLDSISKRYSACGARLGSIASRNRDVMKNVMKLAQARLCAPTLGQIGATALNNTIGPEYFKEMRQEYQNRRDIVMEYLNKDPEIVCLTPGGAFYIIAKLPIADSEDFAKWMLTDFEIDNATTMISPASGFYASPDMGNDEIRIAYILKKENLEKAMKILLKGIKAYKAGFGN